MKRSVVNYVRISVIIVGLAIGPALLFEGITHANLKYICIGVAMLYGSWIKGIWPLIIDSRLMDKGR